MATKTKNAESTIKEVVRNGLEARQDVLTEKYQHFVNTYKGYDRISSAGILWHILGEQNHLESEKIRFLKMAAVHLLGFLSKENIAKEFQDYHGGNVLFLDKLLIHLITGLDCADNPLSRAETAIYEMELGLWPKDRLDAFELDLLELQKSA